MDILGLFSSLFSRCRPFHWHFKELRIERCDGRAVAELCGSAGDRVLFLPAAVLRMYSKMKKSVRILAIELTRLELGDDCSRRGIRAREHASIPHL